MGIATDISRTFLEIKKVSGRNDKLVLLDAIVKEYPDQLKEIFVSVFDPYRRYGIRFKSLRPSPSGSCLSDKNLNRFFGILGLLSEGDIPRSEARELLSDIVSYADNRERWLLMQILDRHLTIGLGSKSFKKYFPGVVRSFGVQLCQEFDSEKFDWESVEDLGHLKCPGLLVEPKLDGMRAVFFWTVDGWKGLSRSGKPVYNVEHICRFLESNQRLSDYVLDGELWAGDFTKTINYCRSAKRVYADAPDVVSLRLFDMIPRDEWQSGKFVSPQFRRREILNDYDHQVFTATLFNDCPIEVVPSELCLSLERFNQLAEQAIEDGHEGLIVKNPLVPYSFRRQDGHWQKWKPIKTAEFEIVGYKEGRGRLEGSLGALVVLTDGKQTQVGSGLSDDDRSLIWANREKLLGLYAEVKYQEVAAKGRLRFPRYVSIRSAVGGDHIILNEL